MEQFTLHTMYEFGAHTLTHTHTNESFRKLQGMVRTVPILKFMAASGQHVKTGQFTIPTLNGLEANKVNSVTKLQGLRGKAELPFHCSMWMGAGSGCAAPPCVASVLHVNPHPLPGFISTYLQLHQLVNKN